MRGPGYKLSGDVRRTWRCPKCGHERKLQGEITTLRCSCSEGTWMQIVSERTIVPRPLQRPSDIERRPIDFGIEAPPPPAARPEATIIKGAISRETEVIPEAAGAPVTEDSLRQNPVAETQANDHLAEKPAEVEDDWGEGIL